MMIKHIYRYAPAAYGARCTTTWCGVHTLIGLVPHILKRNDYQYSNICEVCLLLYFSFKGLTGMDYADE